MFEDAYFTFYSVILIVASLLSMVESDVVMTDLVEEFRVLPRLFSGEVSNEGVWDSEVIYEGTESVACSVLCPHRIHRCEHSGGVNLTMIVTQREITLDHRASI